MHVAGRMSSFMMILVIDQKLIYMIMIINTNYRHILIDVQQKGISHDL